MSYAIRNLGLAAMLCGHWALSTAADDKSDSPARIDWARDIDAMRSEMPRQHKNLFHSMSREEFEETLARLKERLPMLTDAQVAVEIMRIGSMIRDAHSGVDSIPPKLASRWLPLKFYWYSDGLVVQSAAPAYAPLLGARVIAVDDMGIDEVMQRVAAVTDSSNAMTQRDFAPFRLSRPDLLAALGVLKNPERVTFTLDAGGVRRSVSVSPMPRDAHGAPTMGGMWLYFGPAPGSDWLDAVSGNLPPRWLRHQTEPYWLENLSERTIYVQCNFVLNREGGESLKHFFDRAIRLAEVRKSNRFVLDLRLNGGGDNSLLLPVIHRIIRSDQVNRTGHLFVLIGRRTQSAAQNFVNLLEIHTRAIFVGEPTGESPNHYGDPEPITLPASGVTINLSTLWWQDVAPNDVRDSTKPSISAPLSSADYRRARDPALEAALSY